MTRLNPQEQIPAIYLMNMPFLQFSDMPEKQYCNNNIPSVIPKVVSEKGRMYADLTPGREVASSRPSTQGKTFQSKSKKK